MCVIGRNVEREAIGKALDMALEGPAAIVICSEPGMGKTTLWRHMIARAQALNYQIMRCRPAEPEAWLAFSGLTDLMEGVAGEAFAALPMPQREALNVALLREDSSAGGSHQAVSAAVARIIRDLAASRPVLVAVDDVQWLDAPTANVLAFAARRLAGAPVLLLATTRSGPGETLPFALGQALEDNRLLRVRLGPLPSAALYELVRERTGIDLPMPELQRLTNTTGGNPLYAVEIARAIVRTGARLVPGEPLPLPESLTELIAAQVGALPERARAALLAASALAHPAVDQVLAATGEVDEAGLDSAEEKGIITIREGRVRFAHPLFASVIYTSAPSARRRQLHRRLASIVQGAEEQGLHLALGVHGPNESVASALDKGAGAAYLRGAPAAAANLWEMASQRTPPARGGDAIRRSKAAATCHFVAGDAHRARSMLETVAAGLTAGRPRARTLLLLASVVHFEDNAATAAALCRRALPEAEGDALLRASLHLCAAWFARHDLPGALADAEAAVGLLTGLEHAAGPDMLAGALLARGYYRFLAGRGIAWDDLARARPLLSSQGLALDWSSAHSMWLGRAILIDWVRALDAAEARTDCLRLLQHAVEDGNEAAAANVTSYLVTIECWLGQLQRARRYAAEAADGFAQTGQRGWLSLAHHIRSLPAAYLGEVEAARVAAGQGLQIATSGEAPNIAALHLGVLGFIALSLGEHAAADRYLSQADELVTRMGIAEPANHRFHGDLLEALVARGDLSRAAALQQRLEGREQVAPYPWLRLITARSRAILRAAEGHLDAAAEAAEHALSEAEAAGLPFEYARSLLTAGRIRRRRKEKTQARDTLVEAHRIFADMGATLWAAQAMAESRRLGLRRSSPGKLTATEQKIAELVAGGLTNREVASALFVSEKTVEANLSRTFRKLGIRSRRELRDAGIR